MKQLAYVLTLLILFGLVTPAVGQQIRDKRIHSRGMLHETVYNTGEIGRKWFYGEGTDETVDPLMEWPSRSSAIIDGIRYPGQHNIVGGGIVIGANYEGDNLFNFSQRLYSYGGSSGQHIPTTVAGVYSFPMELERIENFPVLDTGELNPSYDPDEAEEIIRSKWATNAGVTVTRTSRAWSYPDYDDFIIYEYTFENTGDLDGDGVSDTTATLHEVLLGFAYGMGPSMMGFQRWYGTWEYDFMYQSDLRGFFDRHRWLNYVLKVTHGLTGDPRTAGAPDPVHFREYAETGKNGGGLMSPQAPGYQMLFYDTNHLAVGVDESIAFDPRVVDSIAVDPATGTIKQPFINKVLSGNTREDKMEGHIHTLKRYSGIYTVFRETVYPPPPGTEDPRSDLWTGRGAFNFRQSWKAVGHYLVFGPYVLEPGEKVDYSIAELVGYGATEDPQDVDEGGGLGEAVDEQDPWHFPPRWNSEIALPNADGTVKEILTDNYVAEFGYPDYVNSDVSTVKDVADKVHQAYTGAPQALPYWPEDNPRKGVYTIPVPPPAPALLTSGNEFAHVILRWGRQVESFSHPRLTGPVNHFKVYKAEHPVGPWKEIAEIPVGDPSFLGEDDSYEVVDDQTVVGESQYYAVTSADSEGNESGKTNLTQIEAQLGPVQELTKVYAVPNPFFVNSGFSGGGVGGGGTSTPENQIGFYGLPEQCTIRIFSYSGQLVDTIVHDSAEYSTAWFQVSRNEQEIASGIYFFVVETPDGQVYRGKFVIIK